MNWQHNQSDKIILTTALLCRQRCTYVIEDNTDSQIVVILSHKNLNLQNVIGQYLHTFAFY